jgi:hypothetical protein
VGIAIGTATGIVIGMLTTPSGAPAESSDFVQTTSMTAQAETSPAVNASPAQVIHSAVAPPAAATNQPDTGTSQSAAEVALPPRNLAPNVQPSSAAQTTQIKTPVTLRVATRKVAGKVRGAARPIAKQVAKPAPRALASAPLVSPDALNDEQWSLDDEAKPSIFYTEGDLAVVDYDASAGTIQASDGRTFILGTTVNASYATSWEEYRSDVHFRCGQNGSCVLTRGMQDSFRKA